MAAYIERKKWEGRLMAVSVVNALAEAMKPPTATGDPFVHLARMGVKVPDNGSDTG